MSNPKMNIEVLAEYSQQQLDDGYTDAGFCIYCKSLNNGIDQDAIGGDIRCDVCGKDGVSSATAIVKMWEYLRNNPDVIEKTKRRTRM